MLILVFSRFSLSRSFNLRAIITESACKYGTVSGSDLLESKNSEKPWFLVTSKYISGYM
jgi:uncharacterized phage-associated protein